MKFHVGQEVVCIRKKWIDAAAVGVDYPKYMETLKIDAVDNGGLVFLGFKKYYVNELIRPTWNSRHFRPLDDVLDEINLEIEEKQPVES